MGINSRNFGIAFEHIEDRSSSSEYHGTGPKSIGPQFCKRNDVTNPKTTIF